MPKRGFVVILIFHLFYLIAIPKRVLREHFSKEEKQAGTKPIIPDREALPLGALSYLHVGSISGGSGLKPGMVPGHGWVEHGSSQVIRLTEQRSELSMSLLMLCA